MNTKPPFLIRKLSSNYLHLNQVDTWNAFWDIVKSVTKCCPSWKSGQTSRFINVRKTLQDFFSKTNKFHNVMDSMFSNIQKRFCKHVFRTYVLQTSNGLFVMARWGIYVLTNCSSTLLFIVPGCITPNKQLDINPINSKRWYNRLWNIWIRRIYWYFHTAQSFRCD